MQRPGGSCTQPAIEVGASVTSAIALGTGIPETRLLPWQIDAVRPGLMGSRDDYGQKYCGGSKVPTGNGFFDWRSVPMHRVQQLPVCQAQIELCT